MFSSQVRKNERAFYLTSTLEEKYESRSRGLKISIDDDERGIGNKVEKSFQPQFFVNL